MLAYLDHQATTPCDPAVVAAMAPWWTEQFANPASRLHRPGLLAAAAVDQAHALAIQTGGTDAGPPGLRPHYHPDYYGAYFHDPDGNKICVCCHSPVVGSVP